MSTRFPAEAYFQLAVEWANAPDAHDALLRCAVSRAYYAAYHVMRDYLRGTGVSDPSMGQAPHGYWFAQLRAKGRHGRVIARRVRDLFDRRNDADYNADIADVWKLCDGGSQLAEEILDGIVNMPRSDS